MGEGGLNMENKKTWSAVQAQTTNDLKKTIYKALSGNVK